MFHHLLQKISGFFLAAATITGKMQYIPLPYFAIIANLLALVLALTGYTIWGMALFAECSLKSRKPTFDWSLLLDNHSMPSPIIGIIATVLCTLGLINPLFMVAGFWLFLPCYACVLSNAWKSFEELPEGNPHYSRLGHIADLVYCASSLLFILCCAAAVSVIVAFPPAYGMVAIGMICVSAVLLPTLIWSWFQSNIKTSTTRELEKSYVAMQECLEYEEPESDPEVSAQFTPTESCIKRRSYDIVATPETRRTIHGRPPDDPPCPTSLIL